MTNTLLSSLLENHSHTRRNHSLFNSNLNTPKESHRSVSNSINQKVTRKNLIPLLKMAHQIGIKLKKYSYFFFCRLQNISKKYQQIYSKETGKKSQSNTTVANIKEATLPKSMKTTNSINDECENNGIQSQQIKNKKTNKIKQATQIFIRQLIMMQQRIYNIKRIKQGFNKLYKHYKGIKLLKKMNEINLIYINQYKNIFISKIKYIYHLNIKIDIFSTIFHQLLLPSQIFAFNSIQYYTPLNVNMQNSNYYTLYVNDLSINSQLYLDQLAQENKLIHQQIIKDYNGKSIKNILLPPLAIAAKAIYYAQEIIEPYFQSMEQLMVKPNHLYAQTLWSAFPDFNDNFHIFENTEMHPTSRKPSLCLTQIKQTETQHDQQVIVSQRQKATVEDQQNYKSKQNMNLKRRQINLKGSTKFSFSKMDDIIRNFHKSKDKDKIITPYNRAKSNLPNSMHNSAQSTPTTCELRGKNVLSNNSENIHHNGTHNSSQNVSHKAAGFPIQTNIQIKQNIGQSQRYHDYQSTLKNTKQAILAQIRHEDIGNNPTGRGNRLSNRNEQLKQPTKKSSISQIKMIGFEENMKKMKKLDRKQLNIAKKMKIEIENIINRRNKNKII